MNADGRLSISESGIAISYRRFLADSAPGLIFIVSFIIIYNPYNILFSNPDPKHQLADQTRIALYVMLFLISTPLGLAINAASYFFFDALVHYFERTIFINSLFHNVWFVVGTFLKTGAVDEFVWDKCESKGCKDMWCKDKYKYRCCDVSYKFNDGNYIDKKDEVNKFYRFTNCIAEMMRIHHNEKFELHSHEVGVHTFYRSLAFISIFILFIDIFMFGGILRNRFNSIDLFNRPPIPFYELLELLALLATLFMIFIGHWKTVFKFFVPVVMVSLLVGYLKFNPPIHFIYIFLIALAVVFLFFSAFACYVYRLAFLSDAYSLSKKLF